MNNSFGIAKVIAVHPEQNTVDIVNLQTGNTNTDVQVMTPAGSTNTGISGLPEPSPVNPGQSEGALTGDRDILAVVANFMGTDMVLGFLYPEVCQMLFPDKNRQVMRHASDVYTTIDDQGNTELYHPSGTYLRIGTASAHEDLTGTDQDGEWKIEKNTDKAVFLHLEVANAGVKKFSLDIDPSGNVVVDTRGTLSVHADGDMSLDTDGDLSLVADGKITADAGTTVDITSIGNTTVTAPVLQASASIGGVDITGTGDVSDGTRSMAADRGIYNGHDHSDPQGGTTGAPNQPQ